MIVLLKKNQEYVIAGLVVILSLILGWISAQTGFIEEQVQVKNEAWSAPDWCGKRAETYLQVLAKQNPWESRVVRGTPKPAAPQPEPEPTWTVQGVDRTDGGWTAIVSIDEDLGEGPQVERLKAGDTFLKTRKIISVEKDVVVIDDNGNQERVELF